MSEFFLIGKALKIIDHFVQIIKNCINEMVLKITKETLENNGIEVIVDSVNTLWLNENNT